MPEAEGRISQRHDIKITEDLKRISEETGISQAALVAACIRALAKTWDEEKELTFPFRVVPESLLRRLKEDR